MFSFVPDASKAKGAAAAIFDLIDYQPVIERTDSSEGRLDPEKAIGCGTIPGGQVEGRIVMENVHFRYPSRPHVRVLRDLNLTVEPGTFVALVGSSGCGKSTTIQMLERFYDPLAGRVKLDGHDIKALDLRWYRSQVALVSQEPASPPTCGATVSAEADLQTLYSGTVRFNILLGANKPLKDVSDEELIKVCKDANIYDFVMSLPDGLDTEVGGKGSQLSGGQVSDSALRVGRRPMLMCRNNASPSHRRCWAFRNFWCWTNPPTDSTRHRSPKCVGCCTTTHPTVGPCWCRRTCWPKSNRPAPT